MRRFRRYGQAATEQVILISMIVIAVVGAANSAFIPMFRAGVEDLGSDVEEILMSGAIGGSGANAPGISSPGGNRRGGPTIRGPGGPGGPTGPRNNRLDDVASDRGNRNGLPFELGPPSLGETA